MTKKEFTIHVTSRESKTRYLNIVSDTNNIDYILEKVRNYLVELRDQGI